MSTESDKMVPLIKKCDAQNQTSDGYFFENGDYLIAHGTDGKVYKLTLNKDVFHISIEGEEPPKCKRCGTYKWVVGKMIRGFKAVHDIIASKKKHTQQDLQILEEVVKALPPPNKEKK